MQPRTFTTDTVPSRAVSTVSTVAIRIVLAEDNILLREGIRSLIDAQEGLELVGIADAYASLLGLVEAPQPDVVLTDIRMPPTGTDEGIRAAAHLRATRPGIGVVVLSQFASRAYALSLLEGGSEGRAYLLKERVADVDDLVTAIRQVAAGGSVIDPKVVEALVAAGTAHVRSDLDQLTPRERETLSEMAQGKNNAAVAASLVLSERAVEKHINSIFSKLGLTEEHDVNKRVKAVLLHLGAKEGDNSPQ